MADRILGRLRRNMHERKKEISISSNADQRLMQLIESVEGEPLSNRDYLLLLTQVYDMYRRQRRSQSSLEYIILRMQQVQRALDHKETRSLFPLIAEYNPEPLEEVEAFLVRKRPLLEEIRRELRQTGLILAAAAYLVCLSVLALLLHWNFFVSLALSLGLFTGFWHVWIRKVMPGQVQQRVAVYAVRLDPVFWAFEDQFAAGGLPRRRMRNV